MYIYVNHALVTVELNNCASYENNRVQKYLLAKILFKNSILGQKSEAPTMSYSGHLHLKEFCSLHFVDIMHNLLYVLYVAN